MLHIEHNRYIPYLVLQYSMVDMDTTDSNYFTDREIAAYNAYQEHGSYKIAADSLGKDKSTVYRQVQRFHEKIDAAQQMLDQIED